jgi:hypothetical protein
MPRAFLTVGSVAVAALIAMVVSRYRSDLRKARAVGSTRGCHSEKPWPRRVFV